MKAVVQVGFGSGDVMQLREVARPEITDGRVLLRVRAASLNALDIHTIHGAMPLRLMMGGLRRPKDPVRGVDVAGVVEAVGKDVTQFKPGDEVFGFAPASLAEYASAKEDRLLLKPRQLSFEQGAAVGVAAVTALQGLRDKGQLKPGQRVLINGAGGGVGTFAVQIAKALGAHVTAVTSTRNMDLVRTLGADELIDYTKGDFTRRRERYEVVFDVAANRPIRTLRRVLVPGGIFVQVGAAKGSGFALLARIVDAVFSARVLRRRVVMFIAEIHHDDLVALKELIEAGKVCPAIDRTYPVSETADAVSYMLTGQARAKIVITMS